MIDTILALFVIAFAIVWGILISAFIALGILFCWDYCVQKQKSARNRKK